MTRTGIAAAACAAALVAPLAGQEPTPVLRSGVEQVVVDVVVTDADGSIVPGLTQADFDVFEDGKPQPIATFSEIALPLRRRAAGVPVPAPPDVRTNRRIADGRTYVLLLDDYFVLVGRSAAVKQVAQDFVTRFVQPGDLVAVATTSGLSDATQPFTDDMSLVLRAVDRFVGKKARSPTVEKIEAAYRAREQDALRTRRNEPRTAQFNRDGAAPEVNAIDADHLDRGRVSLRTLKSVAQAMAGASDRRKSIVFVSEGVDIPVKPGDNTELGLEMAAVARAAARANTVIYSLNPRGLHSQGDEIMEIRALPSGQTLGDRDDMGELLREQRAGNDMLRVVAEQTGGTAAIETNQLATALEQIATENSHYYLLGYAPASAKRDGRFHPIDVRVKRPGLTVRARKGYTAPDAKEPKVDLPKGLTPALDLLLKRPLPTAGLPLSAQAVALPLAKDNVAVTIEVAAGGLTFEPKGDKVFNAVDVAILPVDTAGRTHAIALGHPQLTIAPALAAQVEANGLRLSHRLTLGPGAYQLRIAVHEQGRGASGSVICDVEVPDPAKPGLVMTPILTSSSAARQVPSAYNDDVLIRALGGPATTRRAFGADETLSAYAELIDAGATTARDVDLLTIVRDAQGKDIVTSPQPRANQRVAPGQSFAYAVDVPLKAFAPGRYVLRVEARASGLPEPLAQELAFDVTDAGR